MGTIRRHISNQLAPGLGITPVSNFVNIYVGSPRPFRSGNILMSNLFQAPALSVFE